MSTSVSLTCVLVIRIVPGLVRSGVAEGAGAARSPAPASAATAACRIFPPSARFLRNRPAPRCGELEPERRPLAGRADESDPASVCLDHVAGDREPKARSGDAARAGVAAVELREDLRPVRLGDAESLVADMNAHHLVAVAVSCCVHHDGAPAG